MSDYACVPACKPCRLSDDECPQVIIMEQAAVRERSLAEQYPSPCRLPCGCFGPPWPVLAVLGSNIECIECVNHGTVEYDKKLWKAGKGKATRVRRKGNGGDEGKLDIPAF